MTIYLQKDHPLLLDDLQNGLYAFSQNKDTTITFQHSTCLASTAVEVAKLWHLRFGHLQFHQTKFVQPSCDIKDCVKNTICQICPIAKQTRNSFPSRNIKSSSVLELLHVDLWGPYKVKNHNGCSQFLTIIDDFSRYTWVCLIKF